MDCHLSSQEASFCCAQYESEYIMVVEAVSAGGLVILLFIIISAKVTYLGWFEVSDYKD